MLIRHQHSLDTLNDRSKHHFRYPLHQRYFTSPHMATFQFSHPPFHSSSSKHKFLSRPRKEAVDKTDFTSTTVFSNTLAGPGLAAMFTPPPSFRNNDITPSFADTTPTNVTVIQGRMAELKCAVNNLGTKSVSTEYYMHC